VASLRKVSNRITPKYRQWIDASVLCTLAIIGPDGVDASHEVKSGKVVYELGKKA